MSDGPLIGRWKTPKLRILIEANDRAAAIVPELSRVLRRCADGMWEEIFDRRRVRRWPRTERGRLQRLIEIGRAHVEGGKHG